MKFGGALSHKKNNGLALRPWPVHVRRRLSDGFSDERRLSKASDGGKNGGYG